jgi:hypothetical protein
MRRVDLPSASEERVQLDGEKTSGVTPILEQLSLAVHQIVERRHWICAIARKRREIVRAREDIHRINLDRAKPGGRRAHVRDARASWPLHTKAQRTEGEASRLGR